MRWGGAALAVAATGCGHAPCPTATSTSSVPEVDAAAPASAWTGVELEWSMQVVAGYLEIDYTVRDDTDQAIYLLDQIPVAGVIDPRGVLVRNGDAPGVVVFARGQVPTRSSPLILYRPIARHVDAHGTATGVALAPLPLRAFHNLGAVDGLEGTAQRARLEISYLVDRGPDVVTGTTRYGEPALESAHAADELWLIGHELPLPAEAQVVDPEGSW